MRPLFVRLSLVLACLFPAGRAAAAPAAEPAWAQALLTASLKFGDGYYDKRVGLLWSPAAEDNTAGERKHRVRESAWYAIGLLQRNGPGDRERALRIVDAVLAQQIDAPGEAYHGTFYRWPEEPQPPAGARPWVDYDPNWRQFIGTAFALLLDEYEPSLPPSLPPRLMRSVQLAVEGELGQHRLLPSYTNIALMHGFLWEFAASRLHREDWAKQSATWAESVHRLFAEHGTFEEYNTPTYCGVDLYGLALWRKHGPTPRLRELGSQMEAALWRDIAGFYNPNLRNLCGPFDRAYGMDMRQYVALTGIWMGLVLPPDQAPFPNPSRPMDHAHDFLYAPMFVLLGAQVPEDALAQMRSFAGEHSVSRIITPERTATAWISDRIMIGGETTGMTRAAGTSPSNQFHPATIHWQTPGDNVGWILLRQTPRVDAHASANQLKVSAIGTSSFRISVPGAKAIEITRDRWTLPGLVVTVKTDALGFSVASGAGYIDVTYREATHFLLTTELTQ